MKKENRTTAIWVCRVLVHVGIAGIVSGLLMIGYFLYKGNFTTLNSSFEASQGFYDAYDTMMTWAEDVIWIKNNVAPNGTIEEDRLMAVDFTADNGNTLTLHYRLGDINRWYMKGVTIFDDPYADYVQLMKRKSGHAGSSRSGRSRSAGNGRCGSRSPGNRRHGRGSIWIRCGGDRCFQ